MNIEILYFIRIILAGICGLAIGAERAKRQKEAGLRTHFVVAAASCLITCVSLVFGGVGDGARIAAQIVSGIGFLGAGVIVFRREVLHGLTTAAGVWATAGIGMAIGVGSYWLGILSTAFIVIVLWVLHFSHVNKKQYHLLLVKFYFTNDTIKLLRQCFDVNNFERFKAYEKDEKLHAEAVVRTLNSCNPESVACVLINDPQIYYVERLED